MSRQKMAVLGALFLLLFSSSASGPGAIAAEGDAAEGATTIHSRTLEVDHTRNIVTFTGDVKAVNDEMVILCREMQVYYVEAADGIAEGRYRIDKIVSTGEVHITRALGGVATAEKAVYHQAEEKMILTGNPVVRQEKDFVQGDRIVFYLRENRSVAESAEGSRVKAVIFPRSDGK